MDNPLILIENGCDDLHLGKDIIILANLPADQTDFYLCSQIVKAVASSEKRFCGCAELSDVLFLAEDPLHLGKLLLAAASLTQRESFIQTAELLILAHNCFTRACNMEGISKVLKLCQKLTEVLLENCQWSLMVRLLTGIGRYTEMHYIFHLLKDNQQFESLLSKGLDKYTGLKSATLDFVRDDKELFTLVALHFLMYSELAAMFEENASSYLESLELNDEGKILHSDRNVQTLEAAVRAYMHAAQHYIQAKKLKRATAIINQAELVSLQWSFVTGVETGLNADCLLKLQCHQVTTFINNTLSYEEARIVSQAYNISIDWSAALYQQFIIKDNHQYLLAWLRHHELTYTIVQDVARRFQQEKTLSDSVVKNMKQFVQLIMQTDLKYRISSQMGFKDILQTLLSGPELPYLKDTVWLSGFKKQHI
ncbi:spatacsin-like [Lycorma delicatula]|uniref:spatacsin-like n=1 Tax=Lycorma delicatula TaxID=130591 RepID=UPI003F512FFD